MLRPIAAALLLAAPATARAQTSAGIVAAAGGGATYYCIVSRCNQGTTLGAAVAYAPLPAVLLEGGARRHFCFDCDRFLIAEAGAQLRLVGGRAEPFVAVGAGLSSDPEFMGEKFGPYAGAGLWLWPWGAWGLRGELRVRQLDRGDRLGELSLALARRLVRRPED